MSTLQEPSTPPAPPTAIARCLVVDDDDLVRHALVRVIEGQGLACIQAGSGVQAIELLEHHEDIPIVISDIHMPEMDGLELLRRLRERWPDTAVIMLTAVADVETAVSCMQLGAADYIAKPVIVDEVRTRVTRALEKRELTLQNRFYQKHLETRVRQQAQRIRELFLEGVQTLAHALEAKDAYTRGHSKRVSWYSVKMGVNLGFAGDELEELRLGAELHDIGKIGTREDVLNKAGPLTTEEFRHIAEHTVLGERILAPLARETPRVLRIVRSHHERLNGSGFPDGLTGDAIPLEARIVSVADAFDAMTTNRTYRSLRSADVAVEELRRCVGDQFDARVVDAFLRAFPDPAQLPVSF
ncbi:MAG: HD domain-containing phosphohydrolase [Gemmatimonadales bacterium]